MNQPPLDQLRARANEFAQQGDWEHARQLYELALKQAEDDPQLHEGAGLSCMHLKQFRDAIPHFRRVTQLLPHVSNAFVNLGAACNRAGEYQQAIAALQDAIKLDRKCGEGFYNLGYAYRKMSKLDMAASAYREAIRLNPNLPEAFVNVAEVYRELGNVRQAVDHYRKALVLRPSFQRALKGLQEAEHDLNASKVFMSPFGRLIDSNSSEIKITQTKLQLSIEERQKDRGNMETFALSSEIAAKAFLQQLKSGVFDSVSHIHTGLTQGVRKNLGFIKLQQKFRTDARECAKARQQLRRRLLKLKAYEELILSRSQTNQSEIQP